MCLCLVHINFSQQKQSSKYLNCFYIRMNLLTIALDSLAASSTLAYCSACLLSTPSSPAAGSCRASRIAATSPRSIASFMLWIASTPSCKKTWELLQTRDPVQLSLCGELATDVCRINDFDLKKRVAKNHLEHVCVWLLHNVKFISTYILLAMLFSGKITVTIFYFIWKRGSKSYRTSLI